MNKIVWFTGHSGSGKTTLAKELQAEWSAIILDGDEMRDSISLGAGFSVADRTEHNLRVARLAKELSRQSNVIVAIIAPLKHVRLHITNICNPVWIYLYGMPIKGLNHFYQEPVYPNSYFKLNTGDHSVSCCIQKIRKYLNLVKPKYSLFIGRWSPLHKGHLALFDKVRKEGKKIAIAIRDTKRSEKDPFSVHKRKAMIEEQVPDAKIVVIPDIEEVVYGRKVGWGVREIRLDDEVEAISATEIRNKSKEKD